MKRVDEGIFLHRISYSETSLVTTFYTKGHGIQKFIFKGGKKKSHQLYPLSISELNYYGREHSELLNLTSADPAKNLSFQFDPVKSTIAFFIAESILKCIIGHDVDLTCYQFLKSEIKRLDNQEDCTLFPIEFMISFTEILGFQPLIEKDGNSFNLDEGTISTSHIASERIENGDHIYLISALIRGQKISVDVSRNVREKALETMMSYYRIHMPRLKEFETYEIVKEILSA